ncbi:MAG: PAS domain-containing protein, partial [Pseudomonadales bacterium]|nr:PAS domain-containing protein [Pseudomonadales bacterium]
MKIFDAFTIKQQLLFAVLLPVVGFSVLTFAQNSQLGILTVEGAAAYSFRGPLIFLLVTIASSLAIVANMLRSLGGGGADGSRLAQALKVCDTNIMIADSDNNIIYMNDSVDKMFDDNRVEIAKHLSRFNASTLVGSNMDIFHKNPAHQKGMIEGLRDLYKTEIDIGGLTFGLLATPIFDSSNKRTGTVVEWTDLTAQLAQENVDAAANAENQRVKQALDAVATNAMIADGDNNIVYMNNSVDQMMLAAEADIKTDLPNFNARQLMGENIDVFHKDPSHQRAMLESLTETYETKIVVGGRTFGLIANPIIDGDVRIGTVVEWSDLTDQLAQEIVDAAANAENQRVKQALDAVATNAMIADGDNNIVYMN